MHIRIDHGINDIADVQRAIQSPMRVRVSVVPYTSNAFAHENRTASGEHIRVLVHYPEDSDVKTGTATGSVKTAYPVDYSSPSRVGDVVYEAPHSTLPPADESR
jgi:hypothetical protein